MSYKLKFSTRRFESLFGTAYPRLTPIQKWKKEQYIAYFLQNDSSIGIAVDRKERDGWASLITPYYEITIRKENRDGYNKAIEVEKVCRGLSRLSFFSPPRWWNRFMPFRRPSDTFLIDGIEIPKLFAWLNENCKPRDYQIFTKFDEDISIGFRSGETAAMFKLTFGDKDI